MLSAELQTWVAETGTALPFRRAAAQLERLTGIGLGAETVRTHTEQVGATLVAAPLLSQPRVLVVEDDAGFRHLIVEVLTREGLVVDAAANGADGLSSLRRAAPDLVLLDLLMPVMSGWEFLRLGADQLTDVPVVVLSATPDLAQGAAELQAAGVSAVLAKPCSMHALSTLIRGLAVPLTPGSSDVPASLA